MQPVARRPMDPVWVEHARAIERQRKAPAPEHVGGEGMASTRKRRTAAEFMDDYRRNWSAYDKQLSKWARGEGPHPVETTNWKQPKVRGRAKIKHNRRMAIYQRDGMRCVTCGETEIRALSIDHKTPLCRGGTNKLSNLQTMCRPCNSLKGGKTMEEFTEWLRTRAERDRRASNAYREQHGQRPRKEVDADRIAA